MFPGPIREQRIPKNAFLVYFLHLVENFSKAELELVYRDASSSKYKWKAEV